MIHSNTALSPDWSVVAGSGFVAGVLFLALVERLRRTFATHQEVAALGEKLHALESLFIQVRETADEARERAGAAETEQRRQWERIIDQVIRPLERITEKLETVGEAQAAQAVALENLVRRLDSADRARYATAVHRET